MVTFRFLFGFGFASLVACAACTNEPANKHEHSTDAVAPAPAVVEAGVREPSAPKMRIATDGVFVDGNLYVTSESDFGSRVSATLATAKLGEFDLTVDVDRKVKPSVVHQVIGILKAGKPKSLSLATYDRAGTKISLPIDLGGKEAPVCTPVALIGKDGSVSVWTAAGTTTTKKFARGLAGPDMTQGSEALRKAEASCGASRLVLGIDEVFTWGLAADLVSSAHADAGDARIPITTVMKDLVPGRKVR